MNRDAGVTKLAGGERRARLDGVDLGDDDWVRLIEHEMRYGQAAAQRI
jgi:hypothetical protein